MTDRGATQNSIVMIRPFFLDIYDYLWDSDGILNPFDMVFGDFAGRVGKRHYRELLVAVTCSVKNIVTRVRI